MSGSGSASVSRRHRFTNPNRCRRPSSAPAVLRLKIRKPARANNYFQSIAFSDERRPHGTRNTFSICLSYAPAAQQGEGRPTQPEHLCQTRRLSQRAGATNTTNDRRGVQRHPAAAVASTSTSTSQTGNQTQQRPYRQTNKQRYSSTASLTHHPKTA